VVGRSRPADVAWRVARGDRIGQTLVRSWNIWTGGRAPVCLRRWRVSSSDLAKLHLQLDHGQAYGFSPT